MAVDDDAALKAAVGLLEARRDRLARLRHDPELFHTLERFKVNWNRSQVATAARRSPGAPAQARTLGSAAVSEKNLERFQATWNCSNETDHGAHHARA